MHFDHCTSLNELKSAYKALALENHPDMGGDVRAMQEINAEYDRVFSKLKAEQNKRAGEPESGARKTTEAPEEFREVVAALLKIRGIELELCGSWIWVSGDTYEARAELKAAGCLFSRSKRRWYWRHAEDGCRWSRGRQTMGEIRAKYGSEWIGEGDDEGRLPARATA